MFYNVNLSSARQQKHKCATQTNNDRAVYDEKSKAQISIQIS